MRIALAMNAMAEGIESSEFVMMCMSDSYKQSTYCQAEAEYAFSRKRRLVPLIMKQGYKPDGWLGFMIGSRIYVDFGRHDFEIACEKLMTEINLQRKRPMPAKPVRPSHHEKPVGLSHHENSRDTSMKQLQTIVKSLGNHSNTPTNSALSAYASRKPMSYFTEKSLLQWTKSDVLDFLYSQELIHFMPLCETMNGRSLIQLYKMCINQNAKTYDLLSDELKSTYQTKLPIGIYLGFMSSIEELLDSATSLSTMLHQSLLKSIEQTSHVQNLIPAAYDAQKDVPLRFVLPSSKTPFQSSAALMINIVPFQRPPQSDQSYDLLVISDAPPLDLLRAVQRLGLNLEKL